jgi:hypothetical protein
MCTTLTLLTPPGHIQQRAAIRGFTEAEQREIKRQRRLVKNREYAQNSRIKKKQYVEELKQENEILKDQVRKLTEENEKLRSQLQSDRSSGSQFVSPSPPWSPEESSPSSVDGWSSPSNYSSSGEDNLFEADMLTSGTSISFDDLPPFASDTKNSVPFSASFATSFCLFVFMFSFGLFTLPGLFSTTPLDIPSHQPLHSQPIPLPNYGYRTGRSLLWQAPLGADNPSRVDTDTYSSELNESFYPLSIEDVMAEESLFRPSGFAYQKNFTAGHTITTSQPICVAVF